MAVPNSRETFKNTCLRKLGAPVLQIEVDDMQIEDCIDQALSYYWDYHWDGAEKIYLKHQIADEDIANKYITLSDLITGVVRILDLGMFNSPSQLFNVKYQIAMSDLFNLSSGSIIPYYIARQHLELMQELLGSYPEIQFNRHTNKLYLYTDWNTILKDSYIVVECYRVLDPNVYTDIWKDRWLIEYGTALMREQWGHNLSKFNLTLPGNVTFNGASLLQEAQQKIQELRDELVLSPPVMMPQIG